MYFRANLKKKPHIYQIGQHKHRIFQFRLSHLCKIKDGYLLDFCIQLFRKAPDIKVIIIWSEKLMKN